MPKNPKKEINKIIFDLLINPYSGYKGINSAEDIGATHHIANDLGADSLDEVELVMAIEGVFEVDISNDVYSKWETVGDVYKHFEA